MSQTLRRPRERVTWLLHLAGAAASVALIALTGCAPEAATPPAPERTTAAPEIAAPPPTAAEARLAEATTIVESWPLRQRVASVLMSTTPTADPTTAAAFVQQFGLGGFILMSGNVSGDPAQLAELTAALSPDPTLPLLISIDEEGGTVTRLPWDTLPGADTLKYDDPSATQAAFTERAALLAAAGVTVNFGIVADVSADQGSFMFSRALGTDFATAASHVAAAVTGEQGTDDFTEAPPTRVASTLKHFPGHGAAPGDSHAGIPQTDLPFADWQASHAQPFSAGIDAGAQLLMVGHLAFTAVDPSPASLSPTWHAIARDDLGFEGVIVSDDLGMLLDSGVPAYSDLVTLTVASLNAGTDLALLMRGADPATLSAVIDGVTAAVESGNLPAERLQEAATRVVALRLALAAG